MTVDDFSLLSVAFHLAASKRTSYRKSILEYYTALIHFLQDHGLTTRQFLKPGESVPDDFEMRKSDLTERGFRFFRDSLDKWTNWVERGGAVTDVSILERELAKIRK